MASGGRSFRRQPCAKNGVHGCARRNTWRPRRPCWSPSRALPAAAPTPSPRARGTRRAPPPRPRAPVETRSRPRRGASGRRRRHRRQAGQPVEERLNHRGGPRAPDARSTCRDGRPRAPSRSRRYGRSSIGRRRARPPARGPRKPRAPWLRAVSSGTTKPRSPANPQHSAPGGTTTSSEWARARPGGRAGPPA